MPKRPIHLQSPDNSCRRIRRELDFLRDYWNRLLAPNQSCDIRLPELLRANHLIRHLSALPSNHGMQVNVSFTILNDSDCLETEDVYNETYPIEPYNSGFSRSPCIASTARHNNFLRNHTTPLSENYAAIERELIRIRLLASLIERDRLARCQNAFSNQRAAACNWNNFPAGSQASSARMFSGLQERYVNSRERSDRQAHPSFRHKCYIPDGINNVRNNVCSINRQLARQKENPERFNDLPKNVEQHWFQKFPQNTPQTSCSLATVQKKLQSNNNASQNHTVTMHRNDEAMIKQWRSKESMEACQAVSTTINDAVKISHSVDSPDIKPADDVAINKSDKRSAQPINCQGNVLQFVKSNDATDQSRHVQERGHSAKCKLNNLEDQAIETDRGTSSRQNGESKTSDRIKSYFKAVPTIFSLDEKAARSRIRNGRIPVEERSYSKRRVSSPKYANFLRILRKKETDERLHGNSSSRRNEAEKSRRRGLSAERYGNRTIIHDNPQIERRMPIPRSTVHTTYNPVMHSSATDPILDSSGLSIQLLRLAVLLYAPALMPALNSLIAQQNQQTPVSSAFEGSNDLLTQIFRLLNEQQSIPPNLPLVSIESDRVSSALAAETNAGSSRTRSEEKKEKEESDAAASQKESISAGTSCWKSNNRAQQQNGKNSNWRLTSMLTDSDVRLDRNIFTAEDFRKFEEFLRVEKHRSEDLRSLSTRNKNEIVMKEYFRNWLHRLLQQLNAVACSSLPSNDKEAGYPEEFSRATDESPLEKVEESTNRSTPNESSDSSKNDRNIFTEHEEEDSDDQRSFETSATSTSSSQSLQLEQDDTTVAKRKFAEFM